MYPDFTHISHTILARIATSRQVMLVMHRKPDGDTAGSVLAMAHYLESIKKPHTCFCVDPLSQSLRFLPGAHKVTTDATLWHPKNAQFDLLMVFDASNLQYAGIHEYVANFTHSSRRMTIVNIDHHKTNTHFGDHNLIIPTASSTCEIVYGILSSIDSITHPIATCLLAGLITDTGGFMNLATSASAIATAAQLLSKGANVHRISTKTLRHRNHATLKLWGRALERLYKNKMGMVVAPLAYRDLQECGVSYEAVEGLSNFLNILDQEHDIQGICVLAEVEPGYIKGSLRTTNALIDVSKIATLFGGGGHAKAAGFDIRGHLRQYNNEWLIEKL